jgi:hypothetical protein
MEGNLKVMADDGSMKNENTGSEGGLWSQDGE